MKMMLNSASILIEFNYAFEEIKLEESARNIILFVKLELKYFISVK